MDNKASSGYFSIFGFVLLLLCILVAYLSVNMVQSDDSALAISSMTLLVGAMIGLVGVMLLLLGFSNTKRRSSYLYY